MQQNERAFGKETARFKGKFYDYLFFEEFLFAEFKRIMQPHCNPN